METTDKTLADYDIDERTLTVKEAMKIQYRAKLLAMPSLIQGKTKYELVWLDVLLSKFISSKQN